MAAQTENIEIFFPSARPQASKFETPPDPFRVFAQPRSNWRNVADCPQLGRRLAPGRMDANILRPPYARRLPARYERNPIPVIPLSFEGAIDQQHPTASLCSVVEPKPLAPAVMVAIDEAGALGSGLRCGWSSLAATRSWRCRKIGQRARLKQNCGYLKRRRVGSIFSRQ